MCGLRALIWVGCLVGVGCSRSPSTNVDGNVPRPTAQAPSILNDYIVGDPLTYRNLTIFPVSSKLPRHDDRFITLDEGLKAGTVEILETGAPSGESQTGVEQPGVASAVENAGPTAAHAPPSPSSLAPPDTAGANHNDPSSSPQPTQIASHDLGLEFVQGSGNQVNQLLVVNRSDKPLYLMPGEIIIGGSQDRTIGQEFVIQPDGQPVPIEVFCVEHGRWGDRQQTETVAALHEALSSNSNASSISVALASDGATIESVADAANQGKFIASVGQAPKEVLYAARVAKDQSEVWDKVSVQNARSGVESQAGTFSGNYVVSDAVERLEPYIEQLQSPLTETSHVVGVIVAVNGNVETIDVFQSTPLFKKLWPKLLKSYALDAANVAAESDDSKTCSYDSACEFMRDAFAAKVEESGVAHGLAVTRRSNDRSVTFSSNVSAGLAGGMGGASADAAAIHTSVLAH